jgi:hypothetical protein
VAVGTGVGVLVTSGVGVIVGYEIGLRLVGSSWGGTAPVAISALGVAAFACAASSVGVRVGRRFSLTALLAVDRPKPQATVVRIRTSSIIQNGNRSRWGELLTFFKAFVFDGMGTSPYCCSAELTGRNHEKGSLFGRNRPNKEP